VLGKPQVVGRARDFKKRRYSSLDQCKAISIHSGVPEGMANAVKVFSVECKHIRILLMKEPKAIKVNS